MEKGPMKRTKTALNHAAALLLAALFYQQTSLAQVDPWERIKLIDQGKILQVYILISDSVKTLLSGVNDHLVAIVENKKQITVRYAWNHSKIALIRTGENYFIVEGSGNWGENARHEHYEFLNTKSVYEFRKNEILTAGIDS